LVQRQPAEHPEDECAPGVLVATKAFRHIFQPRGSAGTTRDLVVMSQAE
jgi:hypothetical protein